MSIELPEAKILTGQMNRELKGKCIRSYHLQDYERLQRIGMLNKDIKDFDQLVDGEIESVSSRGNVIRVKLNNGTNLVLGPEYGGEILYHASGKAVQGKSHLRVDFTDGTVLTVRLTSMGVIEARKDDDLQRSYVYRRDFNPEVASPIEERFTFEHFSELLSSNNRMLKPMLVGKDAVVVGLSNSAFQDIIYRAKLHPKRKTSELSKDERRVLYNSIKLVLKERMQLGGKDQFIDLYGKQGRYTPAMSPNMKQQTCPQCGTSIDYMSLGGGQIYFCPNCQKEEARITS